MAERPGGAVARRPLHLIWIIDASGSMNADGKIQSLNVAIRETIPHLRDAAADNPHIQLLVRVITFSTGAAWHLAEPTPVEQLVWRDLSAAGFTDAGHALREVAAELEVPPMEPRSLPPVLVMVSDGQATDDVAGGLEALRATPWGDHAVRIAVAIGRDADLDMLNSFIDDPALAPLTASNPEQLVRLIRWASTTATRSSTALPAGAPELAVPSLADAGELTW
jgi:uncharacterized protein YegL